MIKFRAKIFTQWDDTDRLKGMKDSDILAEKKRQAPGLGYVAGATALGATAAGAAGGVVGAFTKNAVPGSTIGSKMMRGAKKGAILGGIAMAGKALYDRNKAKKNNQFYNNRLEYAQRQALRREKKDWKANMTQRDGYSY